ncbi:MAG: hypothetical protein WAR76_11915 [Xanthobacteraceae bacterium]
MSNHFTGRSLGPPLGDQRLDLCDLYAFQSPGAGQQPGTASQDFGSTQARARNNGNHGAA